MAQMRKLTMKELEMVCGGGTVKDFIEKLTPDQKIILQKILGDDNVIGSYSEEGKNKTLYVIPLPMDKRATYVTDSSKITYSPSSPSQYQIALAHMHRPMYTTYNNDLKCFIVQYT